MGVTSKLFSKGEREESRYIIDSTAEKPKKEEAIKESSKVYAYVVMMRGPAGLNPTKNVRVFLNKKEAVEYAEELLFQIQEIWNYSLEPYEFTSIEVYSTSPAEDAKVIFSQVVHM